MADSIILITNELSLDLNEPIHARIVPLPQVNDGDTFDPSDQGLVFFPNGRVRRFIKNGKAYIALFSEVDNSFSGYYPEISFWNLSQPNLSYNDIIIFRRQLANVRFTASGGFPANTNSEVVVAYKSLPVSDLEVGSEVRLLTAFKRIPYSVARPIVETIDLSTNIPENYDEPEHIVSVSPQVSSYGAFIWQKKVLTPNGQLEDIDKAVLADVMQVLDIVVSDSALAACLNDRNVMVVFNAHLDLPNRYNSIPIGQVDEKYHLLYTKEYFARLRLKLIEFRYWVLQYKPAHYETIHPTELNRRIIDLFSAEELAYLPYQGKINLLESFFVIKSKDITYTPTLSVEQEETIVKLVRSIYREIEGQPNYVDINAFFSFLRKSIVQNKGLLAEQKLTYYEILYEKIKDPVLFGDDGRGRKGQFVHAVYNLWQFSKYNPSHDDPNVAANALSHFTYTRYPYYDRHLFPEESGVTPAPSTLNYRSDRILLWYIDNFRFRFVGNKIAAYEQRFGSLGNTEYGMYSEELTIGFYDIFQPVTLAATDADDTIISLPVKPLAPTDSGFMDNAIPVFYLKYVDDLGDYSDFKQTVRIVVDIASLYFGAVTLFRYARAYSLLRNASTGAFEVVDAQLLHRLVGGLITAGADVLASTTSIVYQILTLDCQVYYDDDQPVPDENDVDYNWCVAANGWLFALEMVSMSANALTQRALKTATGRMMSTMDPQVAARFTGAQLECLLEMMDVVAEINRFLDDLPVEYGAVRDYITANTAVHRNRLYEFSNYYGRNNTASRQTLAEFNSDVTLLDDWITTPSTDRYFFNLLKLDEAPLFLRNVRFIKQSDELNTEVFRGVIEATPLRKPPPPLIANDYKFNAKGVHHKDALQEFNPNGIASISNKEYVGPEYPNPVDRYYTARIQLYDSTLDVWKTKNKRVSTFFPDSWDAEKVRNELAYAYTNRKNIDGVVKGKMSDEVTVVFYIKNGVIESAFPSFK